MCKKNDDVGLGSIKKHSKAWEALSAGGNVAFLPQVTRYIFLCSWTKQMEKILSQREYCLIQR